jgi:hypothetical protein
MDNLPFYYYVIGASIGLVLVAIVLYFIPGGKIKVPAIAGCTLASLLAGFGAGVVVMIGFGYHWESEAVAKASASAAPAGEGQPGTGGGGPGGMAKGGPGGGGEFAKKGGAEKKDNGSKAKKDAEKKDSGGGMMAGMQAMGQASMGNFRPTPPKDQLVSLVVKLDLLTSQTPLVKFTDDQKAKIREKLSGLEAKDEIKDDEAVATLVDLLDIVEGERKSLEMVGFKFPGAGGDIPRPGSPNPFKIKVNADHLKTLQERLTSKGADSH